MKIKDVLIQQRRSVIGFTSVRPLGDEHFDINVVMDGDFIKEVLGGTVIAKGQWMYLDEYCEYDEIKQAYNEAVEKGTITYSKERVPDV